MPLRVVHNVPSINVQRMMGNNNRETSRHLERLSSGLRVNRAADDAAGLSISEGMRAEISGLKMGAQNTEQAMSLVQTAEGALNEVNAMLIRMRELSVQSASSTVTDANRQSINAEFVQLNAEIDRIASVTSYNNNTLLLGFGNVVDRDIADSTALDSSTTGVLEVQMSGATAGTYTFLDTSATDGLIALGNGTVTQTISVSPALDGNTVATGTTVVANFDRLGIQLTLAGARSATGSTPASDGFQDGDLNNDTLLITDNGIGGAFQVGAKNTANDRLAISIGDMRASGANINTASLSLSSLSGSQSAISTIDLAITKVSQQRGDLGAAQNRLLFSLRNVNNSVENNQASESNIRDADIAEEVSGFTRGQILSQASVALLAQANALPQNALTLLNSGG